MAAGGRTAARGELRKHRGPGGKMERTWQRKICTVTVRVVKGDPLERQADALIIPSTNLLRMDEGFARDVKRAGGEEIEREARELSPISVGAAVVTGAGRLPYRMAVHAAACGQDGRTSEDRTRMCVFNALKRCGDHDVSVAVMPLMADTGSGMTLGACAKAMFTAVSDFCCEHQTALRELEIVVAEDDAYRVLAEELDDIARKEA